jgi:MFS family permease
LLAPVLTLAALRHGADLRTVSLMIGAYSLTVIAAEFPSGVFADLRGRKRSFVVSALFSIAAYGAVMLADSLTLLLPAMVCMGLGRAFASGSLDALAIDEAADDAALVKVTSRLAMLQSAGLAAGALAGGWLGGIGQRSTANLATAMLTTLLYLLLTLLTVKEAPPARAAAAAVPEKRLRTHLKSSLSFLRRRGTVRMLMVLSLLSGFGMLSVETYWQPGLESFAPPAWLFGVLSCAGFAGTMLGCRATERLLTKKPAFGAALRLAQKAVSGLCFAGFAAATGAGAFSAVYLLSYVALGGAGVAEDTLLNREAPAAQRASILSLFSFVLQIGGLIASLCGYWIVLYADYRVLWLLAGAVITLCAAGFAGLNAASARRAAANQTA